MNRLLKYVTGIFLLIPLLHVSLVTAQISEDLKDFLWEQDFRELLQSYADEQVFLKDSGDRLERLENRSYVEKPGFRVQVFAGAAENNAHTIARRVQTLQPDSVYVVEDQGLYKVQIGNFARRLEAQKMLDRLYYAGVENAWIVKTTIHFPKTRLPEKVSSTGTTSVQPEKEFSFSIQLFVTNSPEKAQALSEKFARTVDFPVWIKPQNGLWKILTGKFEKELQAREYLTKIRKAGFSDAWLTQVEE